MSSTVKPPLLVAVAVYMVLSGLSILATSYPLMALATLFESVLLPILATLVFLIGIAFFVGVYGLWQLQEWGRTMSIALMFISTALVGAFQGIEMVYGETLGSSTLAMLTVILNFGVWAYLARAEMMLIFE